MIRRLASVIVRVIIKQFTATREEYSNEASIKFIDCYLQFSGSYQKAKQVFLYQEQNRKKAAC